jgi:hypothetical protein
MDRVFNGVNGGLLVLYKTVEKCHGFMEMLDVLFEGLDGLLGGGVGMLEGVGEGCHGLMKAGRGLGI